MFYMKQIPEYGIFTNGIPFVKFGNGKKNLLVFLGGPGNELPRGMEFSTYSKGIQSFGDEYTIFMLTRKSGLSDNDYAEMIKTEFGGKVDVIIGFSYGSLITQHLIADHPDLSNHFIMTMTAHKMSEAGKAIDMKYAKYLSAGKNRKALVTIATVLVPSGNKPYFYKTFFWLFGGLFKPKRGATFSKDILIEANAEIEHDATERLKEIRVPVLIICGDRDVYHPKNFIEEMAKLIPNSVSGKRAHYHDPEAICSRYYEFYKKCNLTL
jgi:pimeloyl-ACP methyl ester carboxylesterase